MVAGKPAGGEAADADTHRHEREKQAIVKFIELEQLLAEEKHVDLHQHGEKPKKGNADHGKPKRAVAAQPAETVGNLAEGIQLEELGGTGWRNARDAQARQRAQHRDHQHQHTNQRQIMLPERKDRSPHPRAKNDRYKCAHLQEAVAAREIFVGEHLRQDAVLGRTEEGGMEAHEKDDGEHRFEMAGEERRDR